MRGASKAGVLAAMLLAAGVAAGQIFQRPRRAPAPEVPTEGPVYVILWFDTEDYILPQSDDAAKRLAAFLTQQGIRATFKVVGEKARTLERRGRRDVIGALMQHEIGYHTNFHSRHPTVAEYESTLDWERGAEEFNRRERSGFDDVRRILGKTPTCYGQPGSSWAPQVFPTLRKWGVRVYLDEGGQVGLNGKPFWYGGVLNIFNTKEGERLRPNKDWSNIDEAKANFQDIYMRMTSKREGGIISFYFHPCEFVHQEFWDGVNFKNGANPPPSQWQLPPVKPPDESERAFKYFEDLVVYLKSFPKVQFITASQAFGLYPDAAQRHVFGTQEIADIAGQEDADVSFVSEGNYTLSASEVLVLLNKFVASVIQRRVSEPIILDGTPEGPSSPPITLTEKFEIPWGDFTRTVLDVADDLDKTGQVPNAVWFGSRAVPPESYLVALAEAVKTLTLKGEPPDTVTVAPARLAAAQYVADDSPSLWNWVIFPQGFHAPQMMTLAKLQAWTLKPAKLQPSR